MVECRIIYVQGIERDDEAFEDLSAVIGLPHILWRVVQLAVADEKIEATPREV